jgi:bifunctional non-homologous end joining protein LigD
VTSEPAAVPALSTGRLSFVIQKHDASRLHYDFRLELDGVLVSWAVPKGPSFDPHDRRLAVHVEDHPVAYGGFEGTIPAGQYGAGSVIVWDNGTWEPIGDPRAGLAAGKLEFRLHGHKLAGTWELVRLHKPGERQEPWLLFKKKDEWARPHDEFDVLTAWPDSVVAHPMPMREADATADAKAVAKAASRAASRGPRASPQASSLQVPQVPPETPRTTKKPRTTKTPTAPEPQDAAPSRAGGRIDARRLPGAVRRALPETLSPQLATLSKAVPTKGDWLYEIKFDGYRLLARIARGQASLHTRGGHDWTHKLAALGRELGQLGIASGWIDGEVVVLDGQGRPRFNALQNALDASRSATVVYYVFDIPYVEGYDLRQVPLHARRELLRGLVQGHAGDRVRFSEDFPTDAAEVLHRACDMGLEGIIAKRRDGAYTGTRSADWLKLKCATRQEFVIGGFSDRSDDPRAVGGLALGVYDDAGTLRYAGRVGTGWSSKEAAALRARLAPLERTRSPFPPGTPSAGRAGAKTAASHWVKPELVAEISFSEWTPDGSLRHPSFEGLREDKPAKSVRREVATAPPAHEESPARGAQAAARAESLTRGAAAAAREGSPARGARGARAQADRSASSKRARTPNEEPAAGARTTRASTATVAGVRITHADRVIDAASSHTKLDLCRYYESVADWMLPHLKSRPVSLVRAPDGVAGEHFFQKHADRRQLPLLGQLEGLWEGHDPLLEIANAQALVSAAQMNVVEFHTWNSVKQKIALPDRVIFDIDPGEGVRWPAMQEAAGLVHAMLDELGLKAWLKTSGGKGLHVVAPLAPRLDYETVKDFSQAVVQHLARTIPQLFVDKSGGQNRVGRIFVDYLRNGFNATTAAAYSARARPGLGVSIPIAWDELPDLKGGDHWTISNARDRLSFLKQDPWHDYWTCRQTLAKALQRMSDVQG